MIIDWNKGQYERGQKYVTVTQNANDSNESAVAISGNWHSIGNADWVTGQYQQAFSYLVGAVPIITNLAKPVIPSISFAKWQGVIDWTKGQYDSDHAYIFNPLSIITNSALGVEPTPPTPPVPPVIYGGGGGGIGLRIYEDVERLKRLKRKEILKDDQEILEMLAAIMPLLD